jgi:hypothetical protein
VGTMHRKLFSALVLIAAGVVASACATLAERDGTAPLIVKEQGSFAIGGTVITAPGTYARYRQTRQRSILRFLT